jgi:DNA invertase Pin-like site-specific DNA recombinase
MGTRERVVVVDDDLGRSGASAKGRPGFQRLVAEVELDHVGIIIILGIEMSRLARSCRDWHQLLEACSVFGMLIGDVDGIYGPSNYNDRLLLGLKGPMSEAELHVLEQHMLQDKLNKARRGELGMTLPIGYVRRPSGEPTRTRARARARRRRSLLGLRAPAPALALAPARAPAPTRSLRSSPSPALARARARARAPAQLASPLSPRTSRAGLRRRRRRCPVA